MDFVFSDADEAESYRDVPGLLCDCCGKVDFGPPTTLGACPLLCGPCGVGVPGVELSVSQDQFGFSSISDDIIDLNALDENGWNPSQEGLVEGPDVVVDSGAAVCVANKSHFPGFEVRPSEGSRRGQKFQGTIVCLFQNDAAELG